jgi:phosphatidylglycerophosphate synthase
MRNLIKKVFLLLLLFVFVAWQVTVAVAGLFLMFWTLDAIDGIHAARIGNSSCLTEFFDHMCR